MKFDKIVESVLVESVGGKEAAEDLSKDYDGRKVAMEFTTTETIKGESTTRKWDSGAPVTKTFKGNKILKPGKYWGLATEGTQTSVPILYLIDGSTWYYFIGPDAEEVIQDNINNDKSGVLEQLYELRHY